MIQRTTMIARAVAEWVRMKLALAPAAPAVKRQPLHGRRGYGDDDIKLPK
jgi:hypothetical protein